MKLKIFLRLALAVVFGFIGALIVKIGTPPEFLVTGSDYFLMVTVLTFGFFGFILPDIVALAGKAGVAELSRQIASYLSGAPAASKALARLPFRGKRQGGRGQAVGKFINPLVVDTSALIDGRLVDIVKTGFVFGTLLVIPSVVGELHKLADSADELKRARGRRGLDILSAIKANGQTGKALRVELLASDPAAESVDEKLVKLAKGVRGKIVTVDFNLNKVAKVHGVSILNVNELANAVKTAVLPNEKFRVQIMAIGREREQGVGYLADGTMVVVEGGAKLVGQTVNVVILRVLQTMAGKMIFAKPAS